MCRHLEQQFSYWTNFIFFHVKPQDCATIIVGANLICLLQVSSRQKLQSWSILPNSTKLTLLLSCRTLHNIADLQLKISDAAQKVITSSVQEIPLTYVGYLDNFRNSKMLIVESALPSDILQFFHNIGEIVYSHSGKNTSIIQDIKLWL